MTTRMEPLNRSDALQGMSHRGWNVLPGMELLDCQNLAVPREVMHHVISVESSYNPYAIGVVGGRLQRQPQTLSEAVATARMLEARGMNFSLGLAQVNRHNLAKYGLASYEHAFQKCANVQAGSRILAECHSRSGQDWGKSFSCYYSGNFTTGYRHGYVQKVYASMRRAGTRDGGTASIAIASASATDPAGVTSLASSTSAAPSRVTPVGPRATGGHDVLVAGLAAAPVTAATPMPTIVQPVGDAFTDSPVAAVQATDSAFVF